MKVKEIIEAIPRGAYDERELRLSLVTNRGKTYLELGEYEQDGGKRLSSVRVNGDEFLMIYRAMEYDFNKLRNETSDSRETE
jgi:hypothetical protein